MIIKYKFFNSSKEFEKFQSENNINIFSIAPMLNGINAAAVATNKDINFEAKIGVLVTYKDNDS